LAGVQWQTPIDKQMNEEIRILERRERKEKGNFFREMVVILK